MLKITTIKTSRRCRIVLEGELVPPWVAELQMAWKDACSSAGSLPLIVDIRNVVAISREGTDVLLQMMSKGVRFVCCGVLNRHVVQQLTRKLAILRSEHGIL
jgi:hypothetical protein